jgi:hypothetical protein
MDDSSGNGRWMTYDEIAAVRGTKKIGAVRLVQRHKWRRQAGNDGLVRALVPPDALDHTLPQQRPRPVAGVTPRDGSPTVTPTVTPDSIAAFEAAVAALREQLAAANAHCDAERTRADRAEEDRRAAQGRVDALQSRLESAQAELRRALDAAELLRQVEAERKARGRWARLREAWRGR